MDVNNPETCDTRLQPAKVDASHFVKSLVERPIKVSQSVNGYRINVRVITALRFAQTVGARFRFRFEQTWKSLGRIKVEVLFGDDPLKSKEVLKMLLKYNNV